MKLKLKKFETMYCWRILDQVYGCVWVCVRVCGCVGVRKKKKST